MKRWPLHKAYFWETAPFFRLLLPLAAGIVWYNAGWLRFITGGYALITAVIVFLLFLAIAIAGKAGGAYRVAAFCLVNLLLLFAGFSISWYSDIANDKKWFGNHMVNNTTYLARINDAPMEKERSWKVPVTIINTIADGRVQQVKGNAFIYVYKDYLPMLLHKGDSIIVPGKWQPIKNAGNPFEFDYAKYCRQNDLYYQQSCSANSIRLYAANDAGGVPFIARAHDWCMAQLDKYITEPKTRGLVQAMLLGDEVNLDEDLRQSYADTGIIHIIAISGGNVAIFFMAISILLWWLKDRKHLWIKYAIALPLVWFYVVMAGTQPSAIRAAIMFSLLAFSVILQKNNNSLNTLFATAFLLLCARPMWLFSLGFQLSFAAVLSIFLFYKAVYSWVSPVHKIARLLWATIAVSIAAEILVAPLVIYYFHVFPLLFIVANVAAYLFMSAVLLLSMAIIAISWIPVAASCLGMITVWLVTVFDRFVMWLQALNPASFHFLEITVPELILTLVVITCIALFLMNKQKRALFAGLITTVLLLLSFCNDEWTRLHQHRLVVFNTGNANHIELIKGNTFTVINTDTAGQKKKEYAVRPAHINWRAWKKDSSAAGEIFDVAGKTALVLNREINTDSRFPVDYLIINYVGKTDIGVLQEIFSPKAIVVGNNYTRREQDKMCKDVEGGGVDIYIVSERGAFVVD